MRRYRAALVFVLIATASCGSDSTDESNGVESKPPREILSEAARALRGVKSFHLESTDASGGSVNADVGLPRRLRVALTDKAESASFVVVDGSSYVKANAAFWRNSDAAREAEELAGRWLKVPLSATEELTTALDPRTLSRCLVKEHGTLVKEGTATVDGKRAVVIVDKGDRPGSVPGRLYVATTGEPLPLRIVSTGKQRRGGERDPECGDDTPAEPGDDAALSDYNEPLDISPPPAAVDFGGEISR